MERRGVEVSSTYGQASNGDGVGVLGASDDISGSVGECEGSTERLGGRASAWLVACVNAALLWAREEQVAAAGIEVDYEKDGKIIGNGESALSDSPL